MLRYQTNFCSIADLKQGKCFSSLDSKLDWFWYYSDATSGIIRKTTHVEKSSKNVSQKWLLRTWIRDLVLALEPELRECNCAVWIWSSSTYPSVISLDLISPSSWGLFDESIFASSQYWLMVFHIISSLLFIICNALPCNWS